MSKIYLIRHGQASFLKDDYDNLSDKGIQQSEALGSYLANNAIYFDKIYIGNLNRHRQTFEAYTKAFIKDKISIPKPVFLDELNEHQALDAFKLVYDEFISENNKAKDLLEEVQSNQHLMKKNYIKIFGLFFQDFVAGKYPLNGHNVQSWVDFRQQSKMAIAKILKNTKPDETVGVFTSGGTKSVIIGDSLDLKEQKISSLNMAIRNASFSQLHFTKKQLYILSLNEIPHLKKELITFV